MALIECSGNAKASAPTFNLIYQTSGTPTAPERYTFQNSYDYVVLVVGTNSDPTINFSEKAILNSGYVQYADQQGGACVYILKDVRSGDQISKDYARYKIYEMVL